MFKRSSQEKIVDFLQVPDKISSKKKSQENKAKPKAITSWVESQVATICGLDNINQSNTPSKILTDLLVPIIITIIGADAYCIFCRLTKTEVFVVSMKDLDYQVRKKATDKTDPRNVIPQKYHDFLTCFQKKILTLY